MQHSLMLLHFPCCRIERVGHGFKHVFVLLPITFSTQPLIMQATLGLAALPSICTVHTAPGQVCALILQCVLTPMSVEYRVC